MRLMSYVLASLIVSPILLGMFMIGRHHGRRQELPIWVVVVLTLLSLPARGNGSIMAVGVAFMVGWAVGFRPTGDTNRSSRRERNRLRLAISRNELVFYYQPIVDQLANEGATVVAAEALVRWVQPNGRVVFPGPWLDTIQIDPELSDAFHEIMWNDTAAVASLFPHIRISVNTMPHRVAMEGWGDRVVERWERLGANPKQFTVEVVEGTLLQDTPVVRHNLECLRDAGAKIALDDFGEGQANMVTFMTFENLLDVVKIDQKLIRHPDRRGAEALIGLARSFNKAIVAEGVETEEHAEWLRSVGVSQVQGWLYAKAMSVRDLNSFVMRMGGFARN